MSSPLYDGAFLEKKGATVRYRLTIIHPDVSDFGTDRFFAWKLLSDWVSPTDDADDATMARKYIRKVELSPLENGTVDEKGKGFFTVKRKGKKNPTVVYTIEVSDPAILKGISVGDSDEVYQYVELDKVIPDEEPVSAAAPAGTRRFELVEGTSSKFWQGHVEGSKLHVQWGRIGTEGQSQVKPFPAGKAQQEFDKLVAAIQTETAKTR